MHFKPGRVSAGRGRLLLASQYWHARVRFKGATHALASVPWHITCGILQPLQSGHFCAALKGRGTGLCIPLAVLRSTCSAIVCLIVCRSYACHPIGATGLQADCDGLFCSGVLGSALACGSEERLTMQCAGWAGLQTHALVKRVVKAQTHRCNRSLNVLSRSGGRKPLFWLVQLSASVMEDPITRYATRELAVHRTPPTKVHPWPGMDAPCRVCAQKNESAALLQAFITGPIQRRYTSL